MYSHVLCTETDEFFFFLAKVRSFDHNRTHTGVFSSNTNGLKQTTNQIQNLKWNKGTPPHILPCNITSFIRKRRLLRFARLLITLICSYMRLQVNTCCSAFELYLTNCSCTLWWSFHISILLVLLPMSGNVG